MTIDFNPEFVKALDLLENSSNHVLITGRAGTGKSTLLNYFSRTTSKPHVILAPTGVAAVNVGGQTIHRFFQFNPGITPGAVDEVSDKRRKKLYKSLRTIIIDEISMVRAELFDCIDQFLQFNGPFPMRPFGGVQMVLIGDLYQLSPIQKSDERKIFTTLYDSPYFFSSDAFKSVTVEYVELDKIYRQQDNEFIRILNAVRNNTVTDEDIEKLNKRVDETFEPPPEKFYIHITGTNAAADRINSEEIAKLSGEAVRIKGIVSGDYGRESMPTQSEIDLKAGAVIMLLNNDQASRWINGTLGVLKSWGKDDSGPFLIADLDDGQRVRIEPYTWTIFRYYVTKKGELATETLGTFTQFPVRLSFSCTVHKSQGKTFKHAIIDLDRTFAHGQAYVALSRCTSLEGMVLRKPIKKGHIRLDHAVVRFLTGLQYDISRKTLSLDDKIAMLKNAMQEGRAVEIVYLKAKDEKSKRRVIPLNVGQGEYNGHVFPELVAKCLLRNDSRVFNIDRIIELKTASK